MVSSIFSAHRILLNDVGYVSKKLSVTDTAAAAADASVVHAVLIFLRYFCSFVYLCFYFSVVVSRIFLQRAAKLALQPLLMLRHIRLSVRLSVRSSYSGIVSETRRDEVFTIG